MQQKFEEIIYGNAASLIIPSGNDNGYSIDIINKSFHNRENDILESH